MLLVIERQGLAIEQVAGDTRFLLGIDPERVLGLSVSMLLENDTEAFVNGQRPARYTPEPADVTELARLLLAHDAQVACAFAQTIRERGAPFDCLCRELFAPAARQLGRLWESERCDFKTFEFALSRLYAVLQQLGAAER